MKLPDWCPELNPAELIFNVVVQRFATSCNGPKVTLNTDVIDFLNEVIDSVTSNISLSFYEKHSYNNFYQIALLFSLINVFISTLYSTSTNKVMMLYFFYLYQKIAKKKLIWVFIMQFCVIVMCFYKVTVGLMCH